MKMSDKKKRLAEEGTKLISRSISNLLMSYCAASFIFRNILYRSEDEVVVLQTSIRNPVLISAELRYILTKDFSLSW
jgi:hypothetical protein